MSFIFDNHYSEDKPSFSVFRQLLVKSCKQFISLNHVCIVNSLVAGGVQVAVAAEAVSSMLTSLRVISFWEGVSNECSLLSKPTRCCRTGRLTLCNFATGKTCLLQSHYRSAATAGGRPTQSASGKESELQEAFWKKHVNNVIS